MSDIPLSIKSEFFDERRLSWGWVLHAGRQGRSEVWERIVDVDQHALV
jgi:hypothetical protein